MITRFSDALTKTDLFSLRGLFLSLSLALSAPCQAEILTLTPSKDNTLYESSDGSLSNGIGFYLFVGATADNGNRRALLHFDLSAIPRGSILRSAELTLYMDKSNAGATTIGTHVVLADWGEGTSAGARGEGLGGSASSGDATWMHTFYPNTSWSQPGGDFTPAPSAIQDVDGIGSYSWTGDPLRADVQHWIDHPEQHFGWILLGTEGPTATAKRFISGDSIDSLRHPTLHIDYGPPPSPTLRGDFNDDGTVDFDDFFAFTDHFGLTFDDPNWDSIYDLDGDSDTDFDDFFVFADLYGTRR